MLLTREARGAYAAKDVVEPVKRQVRELAREYGIADRRPRRTLVPPGAEQLSLATAIR